MPAVSAAFQTFVDDLDLSHFGAAELLHGIDRTAGSTRNRMPPREIWPNVVPTILLLDTLRREIGAPIRILSGYRAPEYNRAVGGVGRSQHQDFRALDFTCDVGEPDDWAALLRAWRHGPFASPVPLELRSVHAPFDRAELRVNASPHGVAFLFRGGVGVYPASRFVHLDVRGTNADWRGR